MGNGVGLGVESDAESGCESSFGSTMVGTGPTRSELYRKRVNDLVGTEAVLVSRGYGCEGHD